jgi:hypothetical protein
MIVLGGNMRLKACKEAGLKEVPVIFADDLTEEQQREFIIKDNVGFGEWDWEMIANEWDAEQLDEWGLNVPDFGNQEIKLPSDEQKEPDNFDGMIVVLKIKHETFPLVKTQIENICTEYGIEIDIS